MADWVAETKRMAYGSLADQMNLIAANAAAGATSLQMELSVDGVSPGTLVCSGLNTWWVKGVNPATNTLHVVPGYEGSPQSAVAIGDFVTIRPRVTDWYVFKTLNSVIKSLSSPSNGLYQLAAWYANIDTLWNTYPLPTEAIWMMNLVRVRARYPWSSDQWFTLRPSDYELQRDSGVVKLHIALAANSQLQFVYKSPFVAGTALDDDCATDLGFPEEMMDIPPLGAVATLLRTTESRRGQVQVQGDPRRASEVNAGSNVSASREFDRLFRQRVNEEAARLTTQQPIFRGV